MIKRILALLLGMVLLASCSYGKNEEEPVSDSESQVESQPEEESEPEERVKIPQAGGTLYVTMENEGVYNPLLESNESVGQILNLVFSPLIDWDEEGRPNASIASAWVMSEDNRQATLTIDTSIQWHNGKHVAPGDVVYSIEVLKQVESSMYKDCVANIESANVIDEKTVRIVFKEPSLLNLNTLYFPVISKEYYNGTMEELLGHTTEPMGSGPYRFESYTPMKELVLTANTGYFGQVPYIEKVVIRLSYSEVRQESFNQKLSNLVYLEDINWGEYVGRENVKLHVFSSNEAILLKYNMETVDLNTRKAIAYALDVKEILASTNLDKGDVTEVPVSPEYWYAPTDPALYSYNQQKVTELLDLSEEMELRILVNEEDSLEMDIADAIRSELEELGIIVKLVTKSQENYESLLEKRDYDVALVSESIVDMEDLKDLLAGTSDSMDALLEAAGEKHAEQEVHQALAEIGRLMSEEMPYYSMFVLKQATLTGKGVYGELTPTPFNVYRGIENLYMEYTEE